MDDYYPVDVTASDPGEGCTNGMVIGKNVHLGDKTGCGTPPRSSVSFLVPSACGPDCGSASGAPVRFASGNMSTIPQTDFVVEDSFFPVRFQRTYSTSHLIDLGFGWGWRHNFDYRLHYLSGSNSFRMNQGGEEFFVFPYAKLIDNDSGGVYENAATFVGQWTPATDPNAIGVNYVHDGNTGKGSKSARFSPALTYAGKYEVFIYYPSGPDRASNVPVLIQHAGGQTLQSVDMTTGGGVPVSLGTYEFDAGSAGYVEIQTTGTSALVIADAVYFRYGEYRSTDGRSRLAAGPVGEYDVIHPDGLVYHFDSFVPHRLTSITNPDGHQLTFSYNVNDVLQSITTPAGRTIQFAYVTSGGKWRISSISMGSEILATYSYTQVAQDGIDGRLKGVFYPEDGSGYTYTYSSLDPMKRLLESVKDLDQNIVETHTWGLHPITGGYVVTSSQTGGEKLDFSYSTYWTGTGGPGARKVVVTRHIEGAASETFDVFFDGHGRVVQKTESCASCDQIAVYDKAGNKVVVTNGSGETYLNRFDDLGNRSSSAQVSIQSNQTITGTDEFDDPFLDATRWEVLTSGRGQTFIDPAGGLLKLSVGQGSFNRLSRVTSKFRLQGSFDIRLRYSGIDGAATGNFLLFGVSGSSDLAASGGLVGLQQNQNLGWRNALRTPGQGVIGYGPNRFPNSLKNRRMVLRIKRSGNNWNWYVDGQQIEGTVNMALPNEVYVFFQVNNEGPTYPPLQVEVEDLTVASGTAKGDVYSVIPGTLKTWEYKNKLLPTSVTKSIEPSSFAGLQKDVSFDYDDPMSDAEPSLPNSNPTMKLFRVTEGRVHRLELRWNARTS